MIFGCAGTALSGDERRFFGERRPLGLILFGRNCDSPAQVRALVESFRACVGDDRAPVLIDQEGGRVARLKPPHWRAAPAAGRIGALAGANLDAAREAARLNARLIAAELDDLGVTVDCAPVLDTPVRGADDVIGDRAFAADTRVVAALGEAFCEGLLAGGVLPQIKHIPGHGRARSDSHDSLPVVESPLAELRASDFVPFARLSHAPWAMTAHVAFTAIDDAPATLSARVIGEVIRGELGFDGLLSSDDLSMAALRGGLGERARAALAAGCDVALHCSGDLDQMADVDRAVRPLDDAALARLAAAEAMQGAPEPFDRAAALARLDSLLGVGQAA